VGTDWWVYEKLILAASESTELFGLIEPFSFALVFISGIFNPLGY
jgi:hypothetical protein